VPLVIVSVFERAYAGTCSWIPALLPSVRARACTLALAQPLDDECCLVVLLALALALALRLRLFLFLRLLLALVLVLALALAINKKRDIIVNKYK
jgi:hypothetical protein